MADKLTLPEALIEENRNSRFDVNDMLAFGRYVLGGRVEDNLDVDTAFEAWLLVRRDAEASTPEADREATIKQAEDALASGDVVAMVRAAAARGIGGD